MYGKEAVCGVSRSSLSGAIIFPPMAPDQDESLKASIDSISQQQPTLVSAGRWRSISSSLTSGAVVPVVCAFVVIEIS